MAGEARGLGNQKESGRRDVAACAAKAGDNAAPRWLHAYHAARTRSRAALICAPALARLCACPPLSLRAARMRAKPLPRI